MGGKQQKRGKPRLVSFHTTLISHSNIEYTCLSHVCNTPRLFSQSMMLATCCSFPWRHGGQACIVQPDNPRCTSPYEKIQRPLQERTLIKHMYIYGPRSAGSSQRYLRGMAGCRKPELAPFSAYVKQTMIPQQGGSTPWHPLHNTIPITGPGTLFETLRSQEFPLNRHQNL